VRRSLHTLNPTALFKNRLSARLIFYSLAAVLSSCATNKKPAYRPEAAADSWQFQLTVGGTPTPEMEAVLADLEACLARSLEIKGAAQDACLIGCLRSGEGRNVGGGCFHVCNYPMQSWTPPAGWDECKAAIPKP
jgi:hypothetical protein